MQKQPPDQTQFFQLEKYDSPDIQQHESPQSVIEKSKKQYFYIKITLSVILVILATTSVQTQVQYYGPFVRTIQNFFNYHILQHDSQDIYEGGNVIFYRTQQYFMAEDIMGFFIKYADAMDTFHYDSFFYSKINKSSIQQPFKKEIVKILIISEVDQQQDQSSDLTKTLKQHLSSAQILIKNRIFKTARQEQWILQRPIEQIRQFFHLTVLNKQFYQRKLKRIELETNLYIAFKQHRNCTVQVKAICIFYSGMMMAVKIQTRVLDYEEEDILQSNNQKQQFNDQNLGIRKLTEFHHMNFDFKYMGYIIFAVNCLLFCVELMVIIRTNTKIQQSLREQRQFQKKLHHFMYLNKKQPSPKNQVKTHSPVDQDSFLTFNLNKQQQNIHQQLLNEPPLIKQLSYKERLQIIGTYNVIQLVLSFLVLITVDVKGIVCLCCWAKMSIYLSETGNRMMIGFLFKKAIPAYLKVIVNLSIWLSGFVFFSMVTYKNTKKFETIQLSYYEYLFNYFQYGIFENFRPIQKYGSMYSFLYFIQMAFLVMLGNNILQSILAQQVLKNSNMQDLIQFIQSIQVQCPVCGCPPQIKKKIKLKLGDQNQRQNRFISQYFQAKKQASNKSKYQIKILSPQFSPMFHKSQLKKKQFKIRKISINNISIIGQQSLLNSPPLSPFALGSPLYPKSPMSPMSPYNPRAFTNEQKKKVKIEIGGQVEQKNMSKIQKFSKDIKRKSQIINRILQQLSKEHASIDSSVGKNFHIQFLKKKIQEIKHLAVKIK